MGSTATRDGLYKQKRPVRVLFVPLIRRASITIDTFLVSQIFDVKSINSVDLLLCKPYTCV